MFADPELNMIQEDIIVIKLIKTDMKQTSLSISQACQPINSGAKMSQATSLKYSVVPSPAPPVLSTHTHLTQPYCVFFLVQQTLIIYLD